MLSVVSLRIVNFILRFLGKVGQSRVALAKKLQFFLLQFGECSLKIGLLSLLIGPMFFVLRFSEVSKRGWVGGKQTPQKEPKNVLQKCVLLLLRGTLKKNPP